MYPLELKLATGLGGREGDTSEREPCPLGCIQMQSSVDSSSGPSVCQEFSITDSSDGH